MIQRPNVNVGVFANVPALFTSGGTRFQYDVLRHFSCRDGATAQQLVAYVAVDHDRMKSDQQFRVGAESFHEKLRDYGYRLVFIPAEDGILDAARESARNLMAINIVAASSLCDRVLIADPVPHYDTIQNLRKRGMRVEVVALDGPGQDAILQSDRFTSGYLIPDLVLVKDRTGRPWGEIGSRVRGWCYWYEEDRGFGYMRFMKHVGPDLWLTDARHPGSPWNTAFVRASDMPRFYGDELPSRSMIFEFKLEKSERGGLQAVGVQLVADL